MCVHARVNVCLLLNNTRRLIFRQLNLITVSFMKHYIKMLRKNLISCLQLTICFYAFANISICILPGEREREQILCLKRWFCVGSLNLSMTTFWIYLYMISCGLHTRACRNSMVVLWLSIDMFTITKHS